MLHYGAISMLPTSVDFPAPDGPRQAVRRPARHAPEIPDRICNFSCPRVGIVNHSLSKSSSHTFSKRPRVGLEGEFEPEEEPLPVDGIAGSCRTLSSREYRLLLEYRLISSQHSLNSGYHACGFSVPIPVRTFEGPVGTSGRS